MAKGTMRPWKWMTVDSGRWLCNTTLTLSPMLTRMVGPGTTPLYVQALTDLPGETSHLTISAVKSNCLVPSGSTVGANSWAPTPAVLAGNALVDGAMPG